MTSERPLPPPLEPRMPDCSICGSSTDYEDGFVCRHCDAYWPDTHQAYEEPGEWYDEGKPRCLSIHRPFEKYADSELENLRNLRWVQYRCILDLGHEDKHMHPEGTGLGWTGKEAAAPDVRAIADPHGHEYFPIIKDRRRGFEIKPISLVWPFDQEEEQPVSSPAEPAHVDTPYRPRGELKLATVVDVELPE